MLQNRSVYTRPEQNIVGSEMMKPKIGPSNASMDNLDVHTRDTRNSYSRSSPSDDRGLFAPLSHGSVDITTQNLDFTQVSVKENCSSSSSVSEI